MAKETSIFKTDRKLYGQLYKLRVEYDGRQAIIKFRLAGASAYKMVGIVRDPLGDPVPDIEVKVGPPGSLIATDYIARIWKFEIRPWLERVTQ